jgi:NADH-quinone oxidoreductase subunit J
MSPVLTAGQVSTLAASAAYHTSTGEAIQFWILGVVAVIGALCTVLMHKAVHSALCLAGTMIILAVFYLANGAYFLGIVQIVVYTGAIMMLFLFVVMLVGVTAADSLKETIKGQRWMAALCGVGFGVLLITGIANAGLRSFTGLGQANAHGNVQGLAALLFTKYVFAFELTGALLITAAVGAMVLTHRERTERAKTQRELSEERVRSGANLPPLPAPGVYARHNAVDIAGLLPDGTPSDLTVNRTLKGRGQIRDVSDEAIADLKALEQRSDTRLGRDPGAGAGRGRPQVNGNGTGQVNGNGRSHGNGNGGTGGGSGEGPGAQHVEHDGRAERQEDEEVKR